MPCELVPLMAGKSPKLAKLAIKDATPAELDDETRKLNRFGSRKMSSSLPLTVPWTTIGAENCAQLASPAVMAELPVTNPLTSTSGERQMFAPIARLFCPLMNVAGAIGR